VEEKILDWGLNMEQHLPPLKKKFYYGWVITGLSMISMAFWFGIRTAFAVFFVALIDQFHWSRAEAAGATSISMVAYMIMAPVIGTLVDRVGPRKVILPGIILTGLGLLLCTQIQTLIQFYLFFGVIVGTGVTCLSIAPFTIILAHWFEKKRGAANGLAGMGIGIGIFILVPFTQYLISSNGWRFAFFILSLLVLFIPFPLNAFLLKHRPQEMGLSPDGDPSHDLDQKSQSQTLVRNPISPSPVQKDWALMQIFKTARFWAVILFPSFTTFGLYMLIVHQVRYLVDQGVDKLWAASLFALVGILSSCLRPFWGWFSDRVDREITYTIGAICFSSGILLLILYQYVHAMILLYSFAFFFAAGWGATTPMVMSISGDIYKGKFFGLIYGIVEGVIGISGAVGPWLAGYIFDQTKNYFWAFVLAIFLNLISVLLVWFAAPRKFRQAKF
jgi:MFS family permease